MLTDYDIQRISAAIVDKLVSDEKFMKRMAKLMPKQQRMVNSTQAAHILGINRKSVCEIAEHLGGMKPDGKSSHWMFPEDELIEKYRIYKKLL